MDSLGKGLDWFLSWKLPEAQRNFIKRGRGTILKFSFMSCFEELKEGSMFFCRRKAIAVMDSQTTTKG